MNKIQFWPVEECFIIMKTVPLPNREVDCLVWSNEGFIPLRDPIDKRAKRYANEAAAKSDFEEIERPGR